MKSKKAILMPEVLKIIIAVLCLIILIYLAVKLYGIFTEKSDLEKAKGTLGEIVNYVKRGETEYMVLNPKGWYLLTYKKGGEAPSECLNENCICICNGKNVENCEKGVCERVVKEAKVVDLETTSNKIKNYVALSLLPKNLFFNYKTEVVEISEYKLEEDKNLFDKFLNSKMTFLDKGELTFKEQIKYYVNSVEKTRDWYFKIVYKGDENAKEALIKNVRDYFKDYNYPIWVVLREEGTSSSTSSILEISTGKEREIKEGEKIPSWPSYLIENPQGNIKNIVVTIGWRR